MRRRLLHLALLVTLCMGHSGLFAQGCSQCRDTVSQTNPAVQRSYRSAIGILLTGALSIVAASVFVMRRFGR